MFVTDLWLLSLWVCSAIAALTWNRVHNQLNQLGNLFQCGHLQEVVFFILNTFVVFS